MNILIPIYYLSVYANNANPYVRSLAEGLKRYGHHVVCSIDDFWQDDISYDIVYFQWPDVLLPFVNEFGLGKLEEQITKHKKNGSKIVTTCHNMHPHDNNPNKMAIYNQIFSLTDAFHHMGEGSYLQMHQKYSRARHFIAPHHIADSLFQNNLSSEEARRMLHIPSQDVVIASFGEFRNREEERLFLSMAEDVGDNAITYLAPRMPRGRLYNGRNISRSIKCLHRNIQLHRLNIKIKGTKLSQEEQQCWLTASDIVFIQRKDILNSGNIPLAFSQGKIAVGPNLGNVGGILRDTENFWFDPTDRRTVRNAVLRAINAHREGKLGSRNLEYAKANWTTDKICGLINREMLSL